MALNGLDAAGVTAAYQGALADTGGWFLLRYVSRDELDVLAHGTKGFLELSAVLADHSEKSPLFGLFSFRRRRILLKYVPEGTSRLVQARTIVHFQSVVDRFSSHDAIYAFTALDEFTESAVCSTLRLHADASENSPTGSLVRQSLTDIKEEVEEVQSSNPQVSDILARIKAGKTVKPEPATDSVRRLSTYSLFANTSTPATKPANIQQRSSRAIESQSLVQADSTIGLISPRADDLASISPHVVENNTTETDNWPSSSGDPLPTAPDSYDYSFQSRKPREKAFPRPISDEKAKKSQSAGSVRQKLPTGLRAGQRRGRNEIPKSHKSGGSKGGIEPTTPDVIPAPEEDISPASFPAVPSHRVVARSQPVAASVQSTSVPDEILDTPPVDDPAQDYINLARSLARNLASSDRPPVLTPEKQRLMKALAMRKKQLAISTAAETNVSLVKDDEYYNMPDSASKDSNIDSGVDLDYGDDTKSRESSTPPLHPRFEYPHFNAHLDPRPHNRDYLHQSVRDVSDQLGAVQCFEQGVARISELHYAFEKCALPTMVQDTKRGFATPLKYEEDADDGYESSSSDDALIEELEGAIVEEARRVSLPSSPGVKAGDLGDGTPSPYSINSVMIRSTSRTSRKRSGESSLSSSYPFPADSTSSSQGSPVTKKANMSVGISKRIQTLTQASSWENGASPPYHPAINADPSSSFLAIRRSAAQHITNSPTTTSWLSMVESHPSAAKIQKTSGSPHANASEVLSGDAQQSLKSESVSVTARIVRPQQACDSEQILSTQWKPSEMTECNLIIEHHISEKSLPVSPTGFGAMEKPSSLFSSRPISRKSSLNTLSRPSMDFIPKPLRLSANSMTSTNQDPGEENAEVKKQSRAARMFKRFSNLSSPSRRPLVEVSEQVGMEPDNRTEQDFFNRASPQPVHIM